MKLLLSVDDETGTVSLWDTAEERSRAAEGREVDLELTDWQVLLLQSVDSRITFEEVKS